MGVRISSSALTKPADKAGFSVLESFGDTLGTQLKKIKPYRDVKLNTTGDKWFVQLKYLVPLNKLKEVLQGKDPYLLFAFETVYYLCLRSEKELRNLKVKDIIPDRRQVFVCDGKTGERYVPMCKEMLNIFNARKILSYPPEHYVFSVPSKTKFVKDGTPGKDPFSSGFFSMRFSKRRGDIGINKDFTIYGGKHTRIVYLKNDGARDVDIMALTGHESNEAFAGYLRDLGITANIEDLHKFARTI